MYQEMEVFHFIVNQLNDAQLLSICLPSHGTEGGGCRKPLLRFLYKSQVAQVL